MNRSGNDSKDLNKVISQIRKTIFKHNLFENSDAVLVGLSGGPDSVCLLHALHSLASQFCITISAFHVNHLLRGDEAFQDEEYCRGFCEVRGIPYDCVRVDVKKLAADKRQNLEEAAREARLDAFSRYLEYSSMRTPSIVNKIALAHNANDQAETVFMNIARGTGLEGLTGISYKRGPFIRPLLDVQRSEIEEYCELHNLKPRIDSSNLKNIYTRNKVRLDLFPAIDKALNIDFKASLQRLSLLAVPDEDFINGIALHESQKYLLPGKHLKGNNENAGYFSFVTIRYEMFTSLHEALQTRLIRRAAHLVKGDVTNLEKVHVDLVIKLARLGSTGDEITLSANLIVSRSYDGLRVFLAQNRVLQRFCNYIKIKDTKINIPGITSIAGGANIVGGANPCNQKVIFKAEAIDAEDSIRKIRNDFRSQKVSNNDSFIQYFDYDCLTKGINIRNRIEGDRFRSFSGGMKKLKEFLIDSKIPENDRDGLLLALSDQEIIWVVGVCRGDYARIKEETRQVLKLEVIFETI